MRLCFALDFAGKIFRQLEKEKREKETEKRKKKKGEKEERKGKGNQFLYSSMSLTKPPWRQRTQCISIPTIGRRYPLLYFIHTHTIKLMQMESQTELHVLVEQTRASRRRGAAAPTSLQRNSSTVFTSYCMQGASHVPSLDRVLSGSRRRILDAPHDSIHHPPIHHPPSDSPSTIRSTIHTLLHLESYCGLGEWY